MEDVTRVALDPPARLRQLIDTDEVEALVARAAAMLRNPVFPAMRSARAFPWPLV